MISEARKTVNNLDADTKIRLLIALINDEGKDKLKSSIDKLISRLIDNLKNSSQIITKYLIKSIIQIPLKTPIYAQILSLLYSDEKDLVEEVINRIFEHLHTPFDSLRIPIRLVSFLFECYNVKLIKPAMIKTLIKYLLQGLSSNENHDPKKLELYLFILITNLPVLHESLRQDDPDFLNDLTGLIDDYFKTSQKRVSFCTISQTLKQDLKDIWLIISEGLKSNPVKPTLLLSSFPEHLEKFQSRGEESLFFSKIKFFINLDHVDSIMSYGINVYESQELSPIDRFLIKERVDDILEAFEDNIELCAKYILNFNDFYGTTADISSAVIEGIFSSMLKLPKAKSKQIFYSSLVVNLNRKWPKEKIVFGEKINEASISIINSMETMDIECVERFANFLSFFLSNNNNEFEFERLGYIAGLSRHHHKSIFFCQLAERLSALFDKNKIITIVSVEELIPLFPKEEKPHWKYSDPNELYHYDSQVICDYIINKKDYNSWFFKSEAVGNDYVYLLLSCLFYCKSKTFSHLRESISFFRDAISYNLSTKDNQIIALQALKDVWGHNNVYFSFIFDLVLRLGFIDCLLAVKWIFDQLSLEPNNIPSNYLMFELINIVVNNCNNSIIRIQKELSKEQENMAKCDDGYQTNIVKNIETYEESLEKYYDIERRLYYEIVFKFISLFSNIKSKNCEQFVASHVCQRLLQFIRNYKSNVMKSIGKINEFFQKCEDKNEKISEIINNLSYL